MPIDEDVKTTVVRKTSGNPANPAPAPGPACKRCGANELRRAPRSVLHRLLSRSAFVCGRCAQKQSRFRLSATTFLSPLVLLLIIGAAAYLYLRPPSVHTEDGQLTTVDALARARTSTGALSTFEQMMLKKPRSTLDNPTILQLWKANVGVNVILQMIRTSNPDYDVSASAIIELRQAGVDQSIILAMIDASYNVH